jgi:hypothetical protein
MNDNDDTENDTREANDGSAPSTADGDQQDGKETHESITHVAIDWFKDDSTPLFAKMLVVIGAIVVGWFLSSIAFKLVSIALKLVSIVGIALILFALFKMFIPMAGHTGDHTHVLDDDGQRLDTDQYVDMPAQARSDPGFMTAGKLVFIDYSTKQPVLYSPDPDATAPKGTYAMTVEKWLAEN